MKIWRIFLNSKLTKIITVILIVSGSLLVPISSGVGHAATKYKVTVSAGSGGSITTGKGTTYLAKSKTKKIVAKADSGYVFSGWTVSGKGSKVTNKNSASTTFTMGTDNATVKANFTKQKYKVSVSSGSGGTISTGKGSSTLTYGSTKKIVAKANSGYVFSGWTVSGKGSKMANKNSASTTFTMGTANATVKANFTKQKYKVSVSSGSNGAISTGKGSSTLTYGSTKKIVAKANSGYVFSGWSVSGSGSKVAIKNSASTTFTMGYANATVKANFTRQKYNVIVSAGSGGTISSGKGTSSLAWGTTKTITAKPNNGYAFSGWTVSGSGSKVANTKATSTTFTMGKANSTVQANFVKQNYNVTVSSGSGGTISSGKGSSSLTYGATKTITAKPNSGYIFTGWTVSGTGSKIANSKSASTTFTMGNANATVTANFVKNKYKVTFNHIERGDSCHILYVTTGSDYKVDINPGSQYTDFFEHGTVIRLEARSYIDGLRFWGWGVSGDGSTIVDEGRVAYVTVGSSDTTIDINYGKGLAYVYAAEGGVISQGEGWNFMQFGSTKTITADAAPGYVFSHWELSGKGSKVANINASTTTLTIGMNLAREDEYTDVRAVFLKSG